MPTNSCHGYILAKIRKNKNDIVPQNNQGSLHVEPNKASKLAVFVSLVYWFEFRYQIPSSAKSFVDFAVFCFEF